MSVLTIIMGVWKQHSSYRSASVVAVLIFFMATSARAESIDREIERLLFNTDSTQQTENQRYHCPSLTDRSKTTIAPMVQGKDGVFFRINKLDDRYHATDALVRSLQEMNEALAAQGSAFLFFIVPPRPLLTAAHLEPAEPYQQLVNVSEMSADFERYITALRRSDAHILSLDTATPIDGFFLKRDIHWHPNGAQIAAETIGKHIKGMPFYQSLSPADYRLETVREEVHKPTMAQEIDRLCEDDVPPEHFPVYTAIKEAASGEDALFGDDSASGSLLLLGTSYSYVLYGFEYFLMQSTGMNVVNASINGGGIDSAFLSYATQAVSERLKPEVVLFETLAHYTPALATYFFREAIPALHGECSEKEAILSGTLSTPDSSALLFETGESKPHGDGYFLFLQTDELSLTRFTLELEHEEDGEWIPFDRSGRFNNTGRFFMRLSDEIAAPLRAVRLHHQHSTPFSLEYRLCSMPSSTETILEEES